MSVLFATSQRNDMRPLAFQGLLATDCHEQLQDFLAQCQDFLTSRGMPNAAFFLAEPMHDPNGTIDWYALGEDKPVPLTSLPEGEQEEARRKLSRYARALAALMEAKGGQNSESMAVALLRQAMQHPSADDIYVCQGEPILINWGFAAGTQGAAPEDIIRLGAIVPPPPPPPPPAAPEVPAAAPVPPPPPPPAAAAAGPVLFPGCLSWLLPLLLLALLLWLLLAALGHLPSPLPAGCFRQEVSQQGEQLRSRTLADEEARLLERLQERAALCRPATPKADLRAERTPVLPELPKEEPKKEEPKPEPVTPEELPFFGAAPVLPAEPAPAPAPKVQAQPKEKPKEEPKKETPRPKKNSPMQIPKDAAKKKDLSFLEGCWRSRTDLFNTKGEPIEGEYCFNKKGQGRRFIYERSGARCQGGATARFDGSQLIIDAPKATCSRGGFYVPQRVRCTGSDSATQCRGQELGGKRNTWKATFTRK